MILEILDLIIEMILEILAQMLVEITLYKYFPLRNKILSLKLVMVIPMIDMILEINNLLQREKKNGKLNFLFEFSIASVLLSLVRTAQPLEYHQIHKNPRICKSIEMSNKAVTRRVNPWVTH